MGWCTHAVTGQALLYAIAAGYPAWSREHKSTAGSSGAEAGSLTVTGDSGGTGGVGLPLEGQAFTFHLDGGSSLLAPGQEGRAEAFHGHGSVSPVRRPRGLRLALLGLEPALMFVP